MNTLRNSVKLIGRLGKDPEVKTLEKGSKLAKFSLATSEIIANELLFVGSNQRSKHE